MKTPRMTHNSWFEELNVDQSNKLAVRDFLCCKICGDDRCKGIKCEDCFFSTNNVDNMYAEVIGVCPEGRVNVLERLLRNVLDCIQDDDHTVNSELWNDVYEIIDHEVNK